MKDSIPRPTRYFFVPKERMVDWHGTGYPCGYLDWDAMVHGVESNLSTVLGRHRFLDQVEAASIPDSVADTLVPLLEGVYGRMRKDTALAAVVPGTNARVDPKGDEEYRAAVKTKEGNYTGCPLVSMTATGRSAVVEKLRGCRQAWWDGTGSPIVYCPSCMLQMYLKHAKGTSRSDNMPAWCSVTNPELEHDVCQHSGIFDFANLREDVRAAMEEEIEDEQRENEGAMEGAEVFDEEEGGGNTEPT